MSNSSYSVLLSIYSKENPDYLRVALDSMLSQTVKPSEIVMVKDGLLTNELEEVLREYHQANPGLFVFVSYEDNQGLGYALSQGICHCTNELVARMDTDDYSSPDRMELQLKAFEEDPGLDMLGTQVYEFVENPENPLSVSRLPLEYDEIVKYSKRRNPFRHTPMVFKQSKVREAGGYSSDYPYFEDWDLFNRMLHIGAKGRNLDKPLVSVRVSPDFFSRRGGINYLGCAWKFKYGQFVSGYFSLSDLFFSFVPHALVCIMPNRLRSFIYTKLLRRSLKRHTPLSDNMIEE